MEQITDTAGALSDPAAPVPSQRARDLVAGAYDLHVHVAPDVMKRRTDDLTLARRFAGAHLGGFVLKSHYVPTAERAEVVRNAVPGADVRGGIALNASVGGMNPAAVEIAARSGAAVVWLPTVDSVNERVSQARAPRDAAPPQWAAIQAELRDRGIRTDPVPVTGDDGRPTESLRQILALVAEHGLLLATGHLGAAEILTVVTAARDQGIERIVVTHPEFTSQRLGADLQRELAARGALLERCFTTPYTGKAGWATMFANIRAAGPARSVLSSDLGQPFNPRVEDGIALLADRLLAAGFTEPEVRAMAVTNSRRALGLE
ncbi:MAG: hypothetical protein JO242_12630 [Streptosporangiaceae bacterium]|nr:hypothetical protein [Streptosporangiaceae bacterium]